MNEILMIIGLIIILTILIILIVSNFKLYKKAGRKGWESLIPIYNFIVQIMIAGLSMWYTVLYIIPIVNIYAIFKINIEIAHKFGKSTIFGFLMTIFPIICIPILAFGKANYNNNEIINDSNQSIAQSEIQDPNKEQVDEGVSLNNEDSINFNESTDNLEKENNVSLSQITEPVLEENNIEAIIPISNIEEIQNNEGGINQEEQSISNISLMDADLNTSVENIENPSDSNMTADEHNESVIPKVGNINENIKLEKKFCPNCGKELDIEDAMCFMCGHQF